MADTPGHDQDEARPADGAAPDGQGDAALSDSERLAGGDPAEGTTIIRPNSGLRGPAKSDQLFTGFRATDTNRETERGTAEGAKRPSTSSNAPVAGKIFGNYEILSEVSRGSFGVVYRAQQRGLDRIVALKVLLAGSHASEEGVARFQREAKAAAKLKHPCIVPIYEIGEEEGHHYFAMEFVEGASLSKHIADGAVSTPMALELTERLADAIEVAHNEGVIHRDIKPSNIIIDPKGQAHITDFGLAKQVDLDTQYTQSGTTLGTPAYMPPEQARGEVEKIDRRSDVYALGAVLYEVLTGQAPFSGRSLLEVVVAVINEPVKPPRSINANIHRDIQTIVMKCLEKDPRNRYASAADLRDDLRRFRSGEPIQARPPGLVRLAGRAIARHSLFLSAVAVVLIAVALSVWRANRKELELEKVTEEKVAEAKKKLEEEIEEQNIADAKPVWKRFWWWPIVPGDELSEENAELFAQGMSRPRAGGLDLVGDKTTALLPYKNLVSPEQKRIFGDFDADMTFTLKGDDLAEGLQVGLQSHEQGVPYVLRIRDGLLSVIAPADLYRDATLARRQLELVIKAEKVGPRLIEGEYNVRILREGMRLTFALTPPEPEKPVEVHLWEESLTNWLMKNTQITVRHAPPGFQLVRALVQRKSAAKKVDDINHALTFFQNGDYNGAEYEFQSVTEKTEGGTNDDRLRAAQAYYYMGIIQEICQPRTDTERRYYGLALDLLDKTKPSPDRRTLEAAIRLRRILSAFHHNKWNYVTAELAVLEGMQDELAIYPVEGKGLREPYGWEMQQLVLASIDKLKEVSHSTPESTEASAKRRLALRLFDMIGLAPGSRRLGEAAAELGLDLVAVGKFSDLVRLHRAYPTDALLQPFVKGIHQSVSEKKLETALETLMYAAEHFYQKKQVAYLDTAGAELIKLALREGRHDVAVRTLELLPHEPLVRAIAAVLAAEADALAVMGDTRRLVPLLGLAGGLLENGSPDYKAYEKAVKAYANALLSLERYEELQRLHEGWPTPSLAAAFADAVTKLTARDAEGDRRIALNLLAYARDHVLAEHAALAKAATAFADQFGVLGQAGLEGPRLAINTYEAYPSPGIVNTLSRRMAELIDLGRPHDVVQLFAEARAVMHTRAVKLRPLVVQAMTPMPVSEREKSLTVLRNTVTAELERRGESTYTFRLSFADLLLALGNIESATAGYKELYSDAEAPVEWRARAGLRMGTLRTIGHTEDAPGEIWLAYLRGEDYPEEVQIAGNYLSGYLARKDLESQLTRIGEPQVFTPSEWQVIRAMRLNLDQLYTESQAALKDAANRTQPVRGWPHSVVQLFHLEEPAPAPEPPSPPK